MKRTCFSIFHPLSTHSEQASRCEAQLSTVTIEILFYLDLAMDDVDSEYWSKIGLIGKPKVAILGTESLVLRYVRLFSQTQQYDLIVVADDLIDDKDIDLGTSRCNILWASNVGDLRLATYILIVMENKTPKNAKLVVKNLDKIERAATMLKSVINKDCTVVLESTVPVGTTGRIFGQLVQLGCKVGMSPEARAFSFPSACALTIGESLQLRHDKTKTLPKIVSGIDDASLRSVRELYSSAYEHVVAVSSLEAAEMIKTRESVQRITRAAAVLEIARTCLKLRLNPEDDICKPPAEEVEQIHVPDLHSESQLVTIE
jgi:hypothetical protein